MAIQLDIDIRIDDPLWSTAGFDLDFEIPRAVMLTLEQANYPKALARQKDIELSVCLVNDLAIQELNRTWRGKDKPTNVLSFASIDDPDFTLAASLPGPFHLGDLVLARETIANEAKEQNKVPRNHFTHLLIHGTLHLLGYDHEIENDAEKMETLEINILKILGIENPYAEEHFMPD